MKAAQINEYGDPEVIKVNEVDKPSPKDGQVLVEVKAAGINPFDYKLLGGTYKQFIELNFPNTIGADFAGIITELGSGVSDLKAGDEVYGSAITLGGGSGAIAEFATANRKNLALKPTNTNFSEAASLVLVGVSAIQALDAVGLQSGQKVLIHGGAGGIGSAAIQYAKSLGAYVITTVRAEDIEYVNSVGANEVIDYESQPFEAAVHGVDVVFDTVGGDTYHKSFQVLKSSGRMISMLVQPDEEMMQEYEVEALYQNTQTDTETLDKLKTLVEKGTIRPRIAQEFSIDETVAAYRLAMSGKPKGKVIIKL